MRTIARETASQIALRNRSKEGGVRSVLYMSLVKGGHAVKHAFWQSLAASQEEQTSPLMTVVLF